MRATPEQEFAPSQRMTQIRYRSGLLLQPGHALHGQAVDIIAESGRIAQVVPAEGGDAVPSDVELGGCWVSAGWWDGQADFRDPGTDRAEGLTSGLSAAAQGGFTRVAPVASTTPCCDQPSDVMALLHRSAPHICGVIPVAALSAGREGVQLSEAFALTEAGARAFSDDGPIDRPEMLRRALEYHQPAGMPVFSDAHDPGFQPDGVMHEGKMSTALGLAGNSGESELLRINRDLDILSYAGGRLHFPVVTTAAGLEAIRRAKADGLSVTCGTTIHHLCWTDSALEGFNSDMKIMPPLRSEGDRRALRTAALDGTLDLVVSDHRPRTPEEHDVDFMVVRPGIAGIHAVGPALHGALLDHGATADQALDALHALLVSGPRKLFGTAEEQQGIAEGQPLEITVFATDQVALPASHSKAPNTVYSAETAGLSGRVAGIATPRGSHWN